MHRWSKRSLDCHEFRQNLRIGRRSFLKAGVLGCSGLTLSELLRIEANAGSSGLGAASTRKPSVIILWMRGGPSHIDTWDPKPEAPLEYRGEFGVSQTNVPGILLCDM